MLQIVLALVAALLPPALLFFYIHHQDSQQPEPPKWLWKGVLHGVYSAILVLTVFYIIPIQELFADLGESFLGGVCDAFFCAAIPEEAAKLYFLHRLLRRNPYFDEHLDGIVYATCVGLGFAGFENVLYVVDNMDELATVALMRAIFSIPGHFFFAVFMGYYISKAHFSSPTLSERSRNYLLAFLVPMLIHGIFDALLMTTSSVSDFVSGILVLIFIWFNIKLNKAGRRRITAMKEEDQQELQKLQEQQEQQEPYGTL